MLQALACCWLVAGAKTGHEAQAPGCCTVCHGWPNPMPCFHQLSGALVLSWQRVAHLHLCLCVCAPPPPATCRYTTQLVVRLDGERRVRTPGGKTLYTALLGGVPVVDVSWLTDSLTQGRLLPVEDYLAKVQL